ncbi:MAG: sulfite exporter TauE/SafE family protein [Candidatus Moranbacteria bacterium]|nr:sulfite exporter TauE/SafE family protein [Candidatus Moranbacteria bacterium]MDD3964758.1 sulfite exporter TauE/SafE family protein [Candidatus Moranbacteria bacterium]
MNKIIVDITGMTCRSCELITEDELGSVSGVTKVKTNFRTGKAELWYDGARPSDTSIARAIQKSGYAVGKGKKNWINNDVSAWVETLFALGIVFVLFVIAQSLGLFNISLGASEKLTNLSFVLLLGVVAGLSTCMAMVGGLVLAMSARFSERHPEASIRQKFMPNVYFNIGRIGGFAILGGLLGSLGATFQLSSLSVGVMTILIGGVMLLVGLQLLELFPRLSMWKLQLPKSIARILGIQSQTKKEYSHGRAMLLGMMTFFLPCGFTQLVQLFVVAQGSFFVGAVTLGAFALGTAPGLLGIGGITASAQGTFRQFFFKSAGIIVIALGIFNFQNGSALVRLGSETRGMNIEQNDRGANEEPQVIRIVQDANGYTPRQLTVKKGQPVKLIIDSEDSYTCATSFTMPKAGIRKTLKPGENVLEFIPGETGALPFSCSMGMYRGVINVIE